MLDSVNTGFNLVYPGTQLKAQSNSKYVNLTKHTKDIISMYLESKCSLEELGSYYNTGAGPIKRILTDNNIKIERYVSRRPFEDIYSEYLSTYLSLAQIARKYNIAGSSLLFAFRQRKYLLKQQLTDYDIFLIHERYFNFNASVQTLAEEYKIHLTTIYRLFKKHNLSLLIDKNNEKK